MIFAKIRNAWARFKRESTMPKIKVSGRGYKPFNEKEANRVHYTRAKTWEVKGNHAGQGTITDTTKEG